MRRYCDGYWLEKKYYDFFSQRYSIVIGFMYNAPSVEAARYLNLFTE